MHLFNLSPFRVETLLAASPRGEEMLAVVVKATYEVGCGAARLSDEQEGIALADSYYGEPGKSSLRQVGERPLFKPATDVILTGSVYPPKPGSPHVDVVLRVAKRQKTVRVFGDRTWDKGFLSVAPSEPAPLERMPLVYERAYGGIDESAGEAEGRNPVGVGFRGKRSALPIAGAPLPNLEDPSKLIRSPEDRPGPACFGFVGPHWEPRVKLAGTYDAHWQVHTAPLLPPDYDTRFQQVAPPDQIFPGYLEGGEPVEVWNASPGGHLSFPVPKPRIEVVVALFEERCRLPVHLDTVVIDGDAEHLLLTWRGSLSVHNRVYEVEWIRVSLEEGP